MIPVQDFDLLSAYLDDQLVPAEKAALEARLAAEPELRATLRDLRLTVKALRALPPVTPPRSFLLTPAMVGQAKPAQPARRPVFPALRAAAAFSALALAVVVFADLRGAVLTASPAEVANSTALLTTSEPAVAPQDMMITETPADEEVTVMMESAPAQAPTATPESETAMGGADAASTPESSAQLVAPPTPTPSAERSAATPAAEEGDGTKSAEAATETPLSVAEVPPAATAAVTDDLFYDYSATSGAAAPQPAAPQLSGVRVVELGLAMLTVLLVVGAWLTRRNA